jgi:hypothetical protein
MTRRHALIALLAAGLLVALAGAWAVPLLIVLVLLLTGRYVGEARILAARRLPPSRSRAARSRWSRRRALTLVSLLERAPRSQRGPPALVA